MSVHQKILYENSAAVPLNDTVRGVAACYVMPRTIHAIATVNAMIHASSDMFLLVHTQLDELFTPPTQSLIFFSILRVLGILIPPAFGLIGTPSQKGTGPGKSIQRRLMEVAATTDAPVSYLQYLQETDLSTCLLKDHMQPGLSVAPQTEGSTMLVFDVSDQHRATNKESPQLASLSTSLSSLLFVERKFHVFGDSKEDDKPHLHSPLLTVQLRGSPTSASSSSAAPQPSLSTSWHVAPSLLLFASTSTSGLGWVGGHWDKTLKFQDNWSIPTKQSDEEYKPYEGLDTMCRNTVNCKVGAWAPIDWKALGTIAEQRSLHGYAAVNLLGASGAFHASVPLNLNQSHSGLPLVSTSSYFSMNVSDTDRPPLQITLEQRNHATNQRPDEQHVASVALSQVLAFDRWQWNVWEDRAPYVRNTIAWTIRMETSSSSSPQANGADAMEDSGTTHSSPRLSRTSRVSLGAAWQLNRGLAIKAVLDPHEQRLTSAILLKRWNYPRVSCSLLHSWDFGNSLSPRFLGVGIELETGAVETNPDAYYYNHHPNQTTLELPNCLGVPKTRATLPGKPRTSNSDL
jgi:hypothetical protein